MTGSRYLDEAERWRTRCVAMLSRTQQADAIIKRAAAGEDVRLLAEVHLRLYPSHDLPSLGDESPGMLTW
jgi:hypothetical protein